MTLQFADEKLKGDREIVLAAVKSSGLALEFAAEKFKRDRDIALAAVTQTDFALEYVHESLMRDRAFVLSVIAQKPSALGDFVDVVHESLQCDRDIRMALCRASLLWGRGPHGFGFLGFGFES